MRYLIGVALLVFYGTAMAADLDKPIENKPTVKTEIVRGIKAAISCGSSAFKMLEYSKCVYGTQDINHQKMTQLDAFSLGLFFRAWVDADIAYGAVSKSDKFPDVIEVNKVVADGFYSVFTDYMRKTGVSTEQISEVSGMDLPNLQARAARYQK